MQAVGTGFSANTLSHLKKNRREFEQFAWLWDATLTRWLSENIGVCTTAWSAVSRRFPSLTKASI